MPRMEHVKDGQWEKSCTVCKTVLRVQGDTYAIAQKEMARYFGACVGKFDEMKSECRSCNSDHRTGRTIAYREKLLATQDWKCGICCKEISFKDSTAHVDHDHKTGHTRKVLCKLCNRYMAVLDDEEWLVKGIAYKEQFRG